MAEKEQICDSAGHIEPSRRELEHRALVRQAAAQGIVLLKNDGLLPLPSSVSLAAFGSGVTHTVKGGTGSGDVNNRSNVSIYQGLLDAQAVITSSGWLEAYQAEYDAARHKWKEEVLEAVKLVDNPFDAYAQHPFRRPEGRKITKQDIEGAEACLYVISRVAGEGKDRCLEKGDYYISDKEREDIRFLDDAGLPIVVVINAGGVVELTDLLEETRQIRAVVCVSQPGQEGGHAVADVLFGKVIPEGKLTATWPRRYTDYPESESFSYLNGNLDYDEYRDGIYVGYRYFDSYGIPPLFPFGFGLSYTAFSIECNGIDVGKDCFSVSAVVKNIGTSFPGREVVQVYVSLPQTGEATEYRRLAGFAKTGLLKPGEQEAISVLIDQRQLAVFSEESHAWTIRAGSYGVWIGKDAGSLVLAGLVDVKSCVTLQKVSPICPRKEAFEDLPTSVYAVKAYEEMLKEAKARCVPVYDFSPQPTPPVEVYAPCASEENIQDLLPLLYGHIGSVTSNLGLSGESVPGSAGQTTRKLEENYKIRSLVMADGPAGLRLRQCYEVDRESKEIYGMGVLGSLENGFLEPMKRHENADLHYQFCTAFPVGTALAQTWDVELIRKVGKAVAAEMEEFGVDLWLAPGMNIQRNPLCGRNFEYYSEDPLLSGTFAAAMTSGVQEDGTRGVVIKHFACNNQEDNRMGVDVRIGERTLREIYLRGFEIALQSNPVAVMSSYNSINGVHAANNRDLCTTVLREEWGFKGIVMTDWLTTLPEGGSVSWECCASGNDIIMPGTELDRNNVREAYEDGRLSEEDIRRSAGRILAVINRLDGKL